MFVSIVRFSYIYISQSSVKMHLRCGEICINHYYCKLSAECVSERILKISQ